MLPLIIIAGPTGSGKTALAIALAQHFNGEILSADSRQIYRGCDIVTAKATPEEQTQAPHHLIDICAPHETFSAAQWAARARELIAQLRARNKTPIICGGSGFYLRALLEPHLFDTRQPDEILRAQLELDWQTLGAQAMHQRLQVLAAARAEKIALNDRYRLIRALQIALSPPASTCSAPEPLNYLAFGLQWPRERLYQRIDARIDSMIQNGAWQELQNLWEAGISPQSPALNGVGYRQMLPALHDESQRAAAVDEWKRQSRRYAKRQQTWFAHQLPATALDMSQSPPQVLAAMREVVMARA